MYVLFGCLLAATVATAQDPAVSAAAAQDSAVSAATTQDPAVSAATAQDSTVSAATAQDSAVSDDPMIPAISSPEVSSPAVSSHDAKSDALNAACFPDCRTGYVCHLGQCVSRCNPSCADYQKCTDAGECVNAETVMPAYSVSVDSSPPQTDPVTTGLIDEHRRNYELRQLRLAYRKQTRISILASVSFDGFGDVVVMGGGFQLGLRKYLARDFSYHLRLGMFAGSADCQMATCGDANGTVVTLVRQDIGFIFGPFGRFYLGPAIGAQGVFATSDIQYMDYEGHPGRLGSHVMVALGGEMGLVFGRYEHMDFNVKVYVNPANTAEMSLIGGVGFHLFPWDRSGKFELLRWK